MYRVVAEGLVQGGNPGQVHALFTIYHHDKPVHRGCQEFTDGPMDILSAQYRTLAYALEELLMLVNYRGRQYQLHSIEQEVEVWTCHTDFNVELKNRDSSEVANDVLHWYIIFLLSKFEVFTIQFRNRGVVLKHAGYQGEQHGISTTIQAGQRSIRPSAIHGHG